MLTRLRPTLVSLGLMAALGSRIALAQHGSESPRIRNIVLVHGAWADGSSFAKIIPLLLARGYHVTAVQNPLQSLEEDVAVTKRAIDDQDGPVILVGHSYGGMVITQAGADPKVAGLVYIAAFAPDEGQSVDDIGKLGPPTPGVAQAKPDADGYLWLSHKGILEDFTPDLPRAEGDLAYVTQVPWNSKVLGEKVTIAAWKTKPSWFVVSANDRMIPPDYERAAAARIHATTTTLASSHVAMLSHPREVVDVINDAASKAGAASVTARGH